MSITTAPYDWERHWTDSAEAYRLNPGQDYRRRLIFEALSLDEADGEVRLLDLGSGAGKFAAEVNRRYPRAQILGLELSQTGIDIARQRVPAATFVHQDLLKPLNIPPKYRRWASHAVCSELLEHVDEPDQLLRNIRPCLGRACKVVITVPGGPMSEFDRYIGHRRHYSEQILRRLLNAAGLTTQSISKAGFPFFNLYRLVTIARRRSLVNDVSLSARTALRLFSLLFAFNSTGMKLGWQLIAVSTVPNEQQCRDDVETIDAPLTMACFGQGTV
jgi:SAM-dependent methyltransferase